MIATSIPAAASDDSGSAAPAAAAAATPPRRRRSERALRRRRAPPAAAATPRASRPRRRPATQPRRRARAIGTAARPRRRSPATRTPTGATAASVERSAQLVLATPPARHRPRGREDHARSPTTSAASSSRRRCPPARAASSSCACPSGGCSARSAGCRAVGKVRERTQASQDITGAVVSVQERLKDARTERRSLLRQLAKATTPNQTTSIRERLRLVSGQIAAGQARPAPRQDRARATRRSPSSCSPTARRRSGARRRRRPAGRPATRSTTPCRILEVSAGVLLVAARARPAARARRAARVAWRRARPPSGGASARSTLCSLAAAMPPPTEDTAELLSRIPVFAELGAEDLGRVAQVAVPRAFDGPGGHLPRGRRLRHVLRRALRPRARDPPALRRPHDHARALRARRHLRRAGDVRRRAPLGHRRGARRARHGRDPRLGDAQRCCGATPRSRSSS